MDFIKIQEKLDRKTGMYTISPRFIVHHSDDILIKGKAFYAVREKRRYPVEMSRGHGTTFGARTIRHHIRIKRSKHG